jgi:hypothetical protein
MRKFFCLFLFVPAFVFAHPDPAYQPLAYLADHCWKGAFPGGRTDEHCFTWIYDGKFLRDRHTVRAKGKPDALGESIYFWDSAAKRLEYLYIESEGGFSRGPVAVDNEDLLFPDTSFVENGKTVVYRSRWQRNGATAYDVITEFKSKDAWVPGFKVHMEQGGAPKPAGEEP